MTTHDEPFEAARAQYARARGGLVALLYARNRLAAEPSCARRELADVEREIGAAKAALFAAHVRVRALQCARVRAIATGLALHVAAEREIDDALLA